jgi:hypothetical protein
VGVKVLGVPYLVRRVKVLMSSDLNGETLLSDGVVHIREDMSPKKQQQTFWHELLHIILEGEPQGTNTQENEEFVTRISNTLFAVLEENGLLKEGWYDEVLDDKGKYYD